MIWLKWLKKKMRTYVVTLLVMLSFNLYFIFLMRTTHTIYLLYLDLLLLVFLAVMEGTAFFVFWKKEHSKRVYLQEDELVYETLSHMEDREVFEHDLLIMEKRLQEKFTENCDLQDYVAKWCHEV